MNMTTRTATQYLLGFVTNVVKRIMYLSVVSGPCWVWSRTEKRGALYRGLTRNPKEVWRIL